MTASKVPSNVPIDLFYLPVATQWSKDGKYRHSILIKRIDRDQPNQFRQHCHQTDIPENSTYYKRVAKASSTPPVPFNLCRDVYALNCK